MFLQGFPFLIRSILGKTNDFAECLFRFFSRAGTNGRKRGSSHQLPEAAQMVATFEPEKLHKYSSGMQAVEFQYLKGGRGSLRTREHSSSIASIYIPPVTAPSSTF